MKRRQVIKRLEAVARAKGIEIRVYELSRHTGFSVGPIRSTLARHSEIDDVTARKFFAQFESALGKGWWRK
ncbi:MAG: hypothetical protein LBG11_03545 [Bifidobacteriaceae bacterium]|nr:hypothetical protein [Bifidobacteriaceae bacterium]